MNDIYVIGVGMTPFGRHLDLDMKALTRQAVQAKASSNFMSQLPANGLRVVPLGGLGDVAQTGRGQYARTGQKGSDGAAGA